MNEFVLLILIIVALTISVLLFFDVDKKLEKKEENTIGKLIVIEGIEGSGKKTLIQAMKEYMPVEWAYTKEPYFVVDSLENWTKENYQLDRETHVQNKILPMLQQNKVLITNRYWMSGCVYDGWEPEAYLSMWPEPDLIIWLDREPTEEVAQSARVTVSILQQLRESYKNLFKKLSDEHHIPIKYIDANNLTPEQVLEIASNAIKKVAPHQITWEEGNTQPTALAA